MVWSRKKLFIIALALVALFGLELGREQLVYLYVRDRLEHGYWQIRPGMTKEQVTEILDQPDRVRKESAEEHWLWLSREHQGWLWRATRLASLKKHYELTIIFTAENRVLDVFGELK